MKPKKELKDQGISAAAGKIPCAEGTLRRLDRRGIVHPIRDSAGRRLFGESDIIAAREYLASRPQVLATV
jgi:DNA-binding transcriptional MerR regulator